MPRFCAHPQCLEGELLALTNAEATLWHRADYQAHEYQRLIGRFADRWAQEATTRES